MAIKAVLFDLDGTLLPMDTMMFMEKYIQAIARAAAPLVEPDFFTQALLNSTRAMLLDRNSGLTNEEVFWADFARAMGDVTQPLKPVLDDFYNTVFPHLGQGVIQPTAHARQAVETVLDKGLGIVVATNPVFPQLAIWHRMTWAGVEDLPWDLVTTYEDMHACKPHLEYYREIVDKLGLDPQECLMVGNDVGEDIIAGTMGMHTGLVTDYLIDVDNPPVPRPHWTGTLGELTSWLKKL